MRPLHLPRVRMYALPLALLCAGSMAARCGSDEAAAQERALVVGGDTGASALTASQDEWAVSDSTRLVRGDARRSLTEEERRTGRWTRSATGSAAGSEDGTGTRISGREPGSEYDGRGRGKKAKVKDAAKGKKKGRDKY